jgi:hypothetical protein
MTVMRVGNKQKKVDIKLPELSDFVHKVYVNSARKLYSNVYIFEKGNHPLQVQRNNREFEIIVKECIYNTIRDNIPVEDLIKMYLEETIEDVVEVTENEEVIQQEPIISEADANLSARRRAHHTSSTRRRRHRDRVDGGDGDGDGGADGVEGSSSQGTEQLDFVGELNGSAASTGSTGVSFGENELRTFETDSSERVNEYARDADDADADDDDDSGRIKIGADIQLDTLDIHSLNESQSINAPPLLEDIEIL